MGPAAAKKKRTADIFLAHVHHALLAQSRGNGCRGHTVLTGARLGDDAVLAHVFSQQRLPDGDYEVRVELRWLIACSTDKSPVIRGSGSFILCSPPRATSPWLQASTTESIIVRQARLTILHPYPAFALTGKASTKRRQQCPPMDLRAGPEHDPCKSPPRTCRPCLNSRLS